MTESEEFYDIYKLNVVSIQQIKKCPKDFNDQILNRRRNTMQLQIK